jgi:hypothetical protein
VEKLTIALGALLDSNQDSMHPAWKEKKKQKCVLAISREDQKLRQAILQKQSNYFDYSPSCADNLEKNTSTTSLSTSSTVASTTACYARGFAAAHSRKLLATLGGSTSTRPGVWKLTLKTYDLVDIGNATMPIALGGSTTTSPPIVVVILRQQLDYIIIDYAVPTTPHPIKAKFSSFKSQLSFTFAAPNTRGLRHEKSSCISLTLGVKMERIISDRPTDRRLTERKNGFGRIVAGYGHGYG